MKCLMKCLAGDILNVVRELLPFMFHEVRFYDGSQLLKCGFLAVSTCVQHDPQNGHVRVAQHH